MEPLSFQRFPRMAPFLTLLITVATLGLYVPYWLYTRTRLLNQMCPQQPIPALVVALCMGALIMFMVLAFQTLDQLPDTASLQELQKNPAFIRLMDAAMIINFLQLLWAMLFCHRLNICTQAKPGEPHYGNYFFLALAHLLIVNIFYLQYKINQLIDNHTPNQNSIGIM